MRAVGTWSGADPKHRPLPKRLRAPVLAALALLLSLVNPSPTAAQGFGWEDIFVYATGVQYMVRDEVAVRAGWNYSENPIPDALSLFNLPAPAIVQQHATLGFGFQAVEGLHVDLAYYHVFENEISGPMYGAMGPISGSSVSSKMYEDSLIMTFSFHPAGM